MENDMKHYLLSEALPIFKALSCQTRIDILRIISSRPCTQREIATLLGISPAIVSEHIKQLCEAELVRVEPVGKERKNMCFITESKFLFTITGVKAGANAEAYSFKSSIPVGVFSSHKVVPTCGLVGKHRTLVENDAPEEFLSPSRVEAQLLWFARGFVEYEIPVRITNRSLNKVVFSAEISSEAPGYDEHWQSEIHFYLCGTHLGSWICPGNYGDRHGKITPSFWRTGLASQYGILKTVTIDKSGTYIDGERMSDVTIDMIDVSNGRFSLRFSCDDESKIAGGITLFGKDFGDYPCDIEFTQVYELV